jgi:hypothetical protein
VTVVIVRCWVMVMASWQGETFGTHSLCLLAVIEQELDLS